MLAGFVALIDERWFLASVCIGASRAFRASSTGFTLGLCRLGRQEVEAADADFKRALALDPALEPRVRAVLRDYSIAATDLPEA